MSDEQGLPAASPPYAECVPHSAGIASRPLPYKDLETSLTGVLFWNEALSGPQPGILLIHGGAGLDEHARDQARRYSALGYTVLACDMYGDAVGREQIMTALNALRADPAFLVRRTQAGLTALSRCPETGEKLAAIGFCFGGMASLALARSGASLAAVVSIHGSLAADQLAKPGGVKAKVLVCHGGSDPHVPMRDVAAFVDEMTQAKADWQLNVYGQARHGFTHNMRYRVRLPASPTTRWQTSEVPPRDRTP